MLWVSCLGYIGEDGFEILVFLVEVEVLVCVLLVLFDVVLIGFGVCDSLRFEVGMLFYGYDMDVEICFVQVVFGWLVFKLCC